MNKLILCSLNFSFYQPTNWYTKSKEIMEKLLELAAKSRKSLEEGEKLCFRGTEVIIASRELFQNLQLLHPRLVFLQGFLEQQINGLESLISISEAQLSRLDAFIEIKSQDADNVISDVEAVIVKLKTTEVVHHSLVSHSKMLDLNVSHLSAKSSDNKSTLYEYLDQEATNLCKDSFLSELDKFKTLREELLEFISKVKDAKDLFKTTLYEEHSSISLEESGIQYAQDKSNFQAKQASIMAQALLSLANHYDQITEALNAEENQISIEDSKIFILERDTEELPSIFDELEQSLQIIESVHEDAIVRQQLFHMVYQEKSQFFTQINDFNNTFTNLCDLVRTIDLELEEGSSEIEKYLEELWALGTCYEDFLNAYAQIIKEFERRQEVTRQHTAVANQYNQQLAALHEEEIKTRDKFLKEIAPFLPGDLSLSLTSTPILYGVTQINLESSISQDTSKGNSEIQIASNSAGSLNKDSPSKTKQVEIRKLSVSTCDGQSNEGMFQSAPESQSNSGVEDESKGGNLYCDIIKDSPPSPLWD